MHPRHDQSIAERALFSEIFQCLQNTNNWECLYFRVFFQMLWLSAKQSDINLASIYTNVFVFNNMIEFNNICLNKYLEIFWRGNISCFLLEMLVEQFISLLSHDIFHFSFRHRNEHNKLQLIHWMKLSNMNTMQLFKGMAEHLILQNMKFCSFTLSFCLLQRIFLHVKMAH